MPGSFINPWYRAAIEAAELINWNVPLCIGPGEGLREALRAFRNEGYHRGSLVYSPSQETMELARDLGLTTCYPGDLGSDFTYVTSADQFDAERNLLKRAGDELFESGRRYLMATEKELSRKSGHFVSLIGEHGRADYLGQDAMMLPVEFDPGTTQASNLVFRAFPGRLALLTGSNGLIVMTDTRHMIYEVSFDGREHDLERLDTEVSKAEGIYSIGLFSARKPDTIVCIEGNAPRVIDRRKRGRRK